MCVYREVLFGMNLYEVSKSGKSVTKFHLQSTDAMRRYKDEQQSKIELYQFETTDYTLLEKVLNNNELSLFKMNSDAKVDAHSRLGRLSMKDVLSYNELKRFSTLYYYSLSDRISLEKLWMQYLNGNYQDFNLLHVYFGQENMKGDYCNHLLVPNAYEEVTPFDLSGGGVRFIDLAKRYLLCLYY